MIYKWVLRLGKQLPTKYIIYYNNKEYLTNIDGNDVR